MEKHSIPISPPLIDVGDINEDPRGKTRTVPMKVLCLGMGRNGTESLCTALTMLGIPTYHGWQTIANPRHNMLWYEAALSKFRNKGRIWTRTDFDQMLGRSSACTDNPAAMFAPELITAYPEAKIILNKRPLEKWWASWQANILPIKEDWWVWGLAHWDWECYQTLVLWHRMQSFYFLSSPRRNGPAVYTQHNALVRGLATTSSSNTANNFLEWEPEDGWEPLCKFLGVEVPQEEFPNMNQTEAFRETVDWYFKSRLQRAVRNLVGFVVLVCVVVGVWMWDYARVSDLVVG